MSSVINYINKPSNLPSSTPLYQPSIVDQSVLGIDYVASQIAIKLGYQDTVVKNVLTGLSSSLPELLSMGIVDLDFLVLSLGMTSTTPNPDDSWNATTAPITIRVSLRGKSSIIALVRTLIQMQRLPYLPKVPSFADVISNRYLISNVIPLTSSFELTGQDLRLTGRSLKGYLSDTDTWDDGLGTAYDFDDIALATSTRIITQNPYLLTVNGQLHPYIRLAIADEDNTYLAPTCMVCYGGVKFLSLVGTNDFYADITNVSKFRFTVSDGVLSVAVKSATFPGAYGAETVITEENTIITVEDGDTPPNGMNFMVGNGALEYYSAAAAVTPYEIEGYRE